VVSKLHVRPDESMRARPSSRISVSQVPSASREPGMSRRPSRRAIDRVLPFQELTEEISLQALAKITLLAGEWLSWASSPLSA
jgi:hypothetical protein